MKKIFLNYLSLGAILFGIGISNTSEAFNRYKSRRYYDNGEYYGDGYYREHSHSGLKGFLGGGITGAAIGGIAGGGKGAAIGGPVGAIGGLAIGKAIENRRHRRGYGRHHRYYRNEPHHIHGADNY